MDVDSVAVPVICYVRIVRHIVRSHIDGKLDGQGLFRGSGLPSATFASLVPRPRESSSHYAVIAKLTEASYAQCVLRLDIEDHCSRAWRRDQSRQAGPREPRLPR
jgi:hypothetical protein